MQVFLLLGGGCWLNDSCRHRRQHRRKLKETPVKLPRFLLLHVCTLLLRSLNTECKTRGECRCGGQTTEIKSCQLFAARRTHFRSYAHALNDHRNPKTTGTAPLNIVDHRVSVFDDRSPLPLPGLLSNVYPHFKWCGGFLNQHAFCWVLVLCTSVDSGVYRCPFLFCLQLYHKPKR